MTDQPTWNGIPLKSVHLDDPEPTEFYWPQRMKDDPPTPGTRIYMLKDPAEMTESQQRLLAHLCPYYEAPAESREP